MLANPGERRNAAEVVESLRAQNSVDPTNLGKRRNTEDSRELASKLETHDTRRNVVRRPNNVLAGKTQSAPINR